MLLYFSKRQFTLKSCSFKCIEINALAKLEPEGETVIDNNSNETDNRRKANSKVNLHEPSMYSKEPEYSLLNQNLHSDHLSILSW